MAFSEKLIQVLCYCPKTIQFFEDNNISCKNKSSIADGRSGSFGDDCSKVDGVSDRF